MYAWVGPHAPVPDALITAGVHVGLLIICSLQIAGGVVSGLPPPMVLCNLLDRVNKLGVSELLPLLILPASQLARNCCQTCPNLCDTLQ